jgi:hypothetical protein
MVRQMATNTEIWARVREFVLSFDDAEERRAVIAQLVRVEFGDDRWVRAVRSGSRTGGTSGTGVPVARQLPMLSEEEFGAVGRG